MKDTIILYHADCPDGFSAAWAAWKRFGDSAEYIPVHHGLPPPEGLKNKEIYMIDFVYTEDVLRDLIKNNKKVTAIDHHISREKEIKLTQDYLYAVDHSGAVLAWNYFHKDKPMPKLLNYVEGQDLWKFNLPNAKAICASINSLDYDFNVWNKLADDLDDEEQNRNLALQGSIIVKYEEEMIKRLIEENATLVNFEGYETYVVNAPYMLASEIGHILYTKKPPIAIIWSEDKERVNVSLRSDGTVDVSKLAEKFGGGGHKVASGFSLPSIKSLPWKKNT